MEKDKKEFESPELTGVVQSYEDPETTNSFNEVERVNVYIRVRPPFHAEKREPTAVLQLNNQTLSIEQGT